MLYLKAILVAFLAINANAASFSRTTFGGLSNSIDAAAISDEDCSDCLNVEINKSASGIKKRDGYAQLLNVSGISPSVSSLFDFKNSNGDECLLILSSATLYRSTNLTTAVQVTTFTASSRLYCQTNSGLAYCFTDQNDTPFTYDCVTYTQKTANNYPAGKFNAFTQDRHVVSGVSGSLNTLYISQSGVFDNFTAANTINDPWTEPVGTPGDRITGVYYLNGRIIVSKEYSLVGFNCTDQFNCPAYDISNSIGIANPEAMVLYGGYGYFKASDNRFYRIDASPGNIENISVGISSFTASLLTGRTRSNTQTGAASWNAGNLIAAGAGAPMDSNIIPGSVMPSSVTFLDTSSANFAAGTLGQTISTDAFSLSISSAFYPIENGTFESGDLAHWTCTTSDPSDKCSVNTGAAVQGVYGSSVVAGACSPGPYSQNVYILDQNNIQLYQTSTVNGSDAHLASSSINLYALGLSTRTLKIKFDSYGGPGAASEAILVSDTFTAISTISWQGENNTAPCTNIGWKKLDFIRADRYFDPSQSSGVFVAYSQFFDTRYSTPIGGSFVASVSSSPGTSVLFQTRSTGTSVGAWNTILNGGRIVENKRYWQYLSSFTTSIGTVSPSLQSVALVAATTGQYITQCIQPNAAITAWGAISASGQLDGGSLAFAVSTGTTCTDAGSSFVAQSTGATISIATSTALKVRVTFGLNSATSTARLDSITTNWTEGNVAPPSYGTYWNDGLYWSVANSGSTNNRILKLDTLYNKWFPFDIPANALFTYNSNFYFGATTSGKVYRYSDINQLSAPSSDDGSNINAYWQTKNFSGGDAFLEQSYESISLIARKQSLGTLSVTWNINNGGGGNSDTYSVNLSTGENVVRNNYLFPVGKLGQFLNLRFSNNSTAPFEVLGFKIDFSVEPWRVLP